MKLTTLSALLLLVSASVIAQTTSAPTPPMTVPTAASSDAPIGPRDVLDIRVFQDPNLNTHAVVTDDGKISFPLVGKVEVSGLRPAQVEQVLAQALSKYYQKADVTVLVLEAGNRPISVIGAVMHPGRINATGNLTLLQAITQAGGLAPGYGKTVYVLRSAPNGLTDQIAIDIEDLMVNGNPDLNLPLRPNDVVNIPVESQINIYLLGEVMRPGKVQFRRSQSPTLLQALADAGGPTDRAAAKCVIKRKNGATGKEESIIIDYRRILNGKAPDVALMDDDTIFVRESVF
ncbi:MAG TPA: polysaccharide biosynthesis/export family protein [Thermoanaerobaculia bacterium]|nr:polysaccharide biosynthesis/export family protein [Thermoanaerobaculia bacterium]